MPSGGKRKTTWTKQTRPKSPGRPRGSRDRYPRTWKGSMKAVFENIASGNPDLLYKAIEKGLRGPKAIQVLQLMTVSIDGRPAEELSPEAKRVIAGVIGEALRIMVDAESRRQFALGIRKLIQIGEGSTIDVDAGKPPVTPP